MLESRTEVGRRDKRIIIREAVSSTDEFNAPNFTWQTFKTVWAKVTDSSAGSTEQYESDQLTAVRTTTFNIRYLAGVREKMQIIYDGSFYDIEFIGRPDRKGSLELRTILLDET